MSWSRINTILLQSWYHIMHSMETWVDIFWFPLMTVVVIGYMMVYIGGHDANIINFAVAGYVMWEVARIIQYSITVSMMWDVWSKSLSSLFISPLTMGEMMVGFIISAVIKGVVVLTMSSLVSFLLFKFSFFANSKYGM